MSLPSPVYDREGVIVYHADCLDVLPHLSGVDAIITDPPYGISYKSGHNTRKDKRTWNKYIRDENFAPIDGDDKPFDPTPFMAYRRVAFFGGNYFADRLPPSKAWIIWDKNDGLTPSSQADCEMVWTNADKPARVVRHLWRGLVRAGSENVARQPKHHPHQKPVGVMKFVLDYMGIPADTLVVDGYAGSGSTGVACRKSGRRCILVEKDARYIPTIIRRLEECETPLFKEGAA